MKAYIILVNYNGQKLTEDCIDSIHRAKSPKKDQVKIVVVDNGSRMNEASALQKKIFEI